MPRLLLTRPKEDNRGLAAALEEMDVECVDAPLLTIYFDKEMNLQLSDFKGFLCTSANGVRAIMHHDPDLSLPLFAVGDATARQAERCGFDAVLSAAGDVDDLIRLVNRKFSPSDGPLFHAAGSVTTGNLAERLRDDGYDVQRAVLYEAKSLDRLPEAVVAEMQTGQLSGVIIYSPRTAKTFMQLVQKADLAETLPTLTLFALSGNVAAAAPGAWREIKIAERPDQESLLDSVKTCYY